MIPESLGVELPYPVIISMDGTAQIPAVFAGAGMARAFVAFDRRVQARADAYAAALRGAGVDVVGSLGLAAGERAKRFATAEKVLQAFVSSGADRRTALVAVGGGSVTDLVGFCASIHMRGAPWVALATTVLGMADAAIGGKTGVNLPEGKNLAGTFWDPAAVIADLPSLATLPLAQKRAGMAEVIKTAVVGGPDLFALIERFSIRSKPERWRDVVAEAARVKARVVREDPREAGIRASLNFGHTLGHALEYASGFRLRHGDAVAVGMRGEALIAQSKGWWPPEDHARLLRAIGRFGLPARIEGLDEGSIFEGMHRDKKRAAATLRFALPVRVGEVRAGVEVAEEEVRVALRACTGAPSEDELAS